jgi:16S rRNA (cytosine967-C5)-methyltransferase
VKFDNQLRHATSIIAAYQGDQPLHTWLKSFFRDNKQMGSKDRRLLSSMVYGFYRLGHAVKNMPVEERILTGLFLCNGQPLELLQYFKPGWNEKAALPLKERLSFYQAQPEGAGFRVPDIFPWKEELSADIDHEAFCLSFLRQPDLFLRIRPGHEQAVRQRLDQPPGSSSAAAGIISSPRQIGAPSYEFIPPFTLRLPNGFKVEDYFTPDHEVVIQDYSSQQITSFLQPSSPDVPASLDTSPVADSASPRSFWDACSASGGKAILAHDLYPQMNITVSDIRESILHNLKGRFIQAGIRQYRSFVVDLTLAPFDDTPLPYDLILADVPCSGSGTWGRTPEELYFFDTKKIAHYSGMQKKIVSHIAPRLKKGTQFVYATCSVFKKENEEMTTRLREEFGLQQERIATIKGYDQQADSMFAARFHL